MAQIERVTFDRLFPLKQPYANIRLTAEAAVNPGEDAGEVFRQLAREVETIGHELVQKALPV